MKVVETVDALAHSIVRGKIPTKNNRLVILVGLPYSGKSTLAEELAKHNFVHIWATKIKSQYLLDDRQMLYITRKLCYLLLKHGYNVVFDFLNHKKVLRKPFYQVAKKLNTPYITVFVNTPITLIHKRQIQHSKNPLTFGRSKISFKVIQQLQSEIEKPDSSENVISINKPTETNIVLRQLTSRCLLDIRSEDLR